MQNLLATIWMFETKLDTLHPVERQCLSLHDHSPLAKKNLGKKRLDLIFACKDTDSCINLVSYEHPNHDFAYRAMRMTRKFEGQAKRTIEFRQHESMLSFECVYHWVKVCVGLVEFAASEDAMDHEAFKNFLQSWANGDEYTTDQLLRDINLWE